MKKFRYYDVVLALFASALLISNISATKLIAFGPVLTDGGAVLFPLIYIFGDILTEVYGYRYARRAIWAGFAVMLIAVTALTVVRYLPPAPMYHDQAAFEAVAGFLPRIVIASLAAYLIGEFLNSYILAKLKVKTRGKQLWKRLVGSTVVAEGADTTVFALIAFGGMMSAGEMIGFIMVGWTFKTVVEILFLPITYRVIRILKRTERSDFYDRKTDFSPFQFEL